VSELPRFHNISSPNSNCYLQSEFFALWHLHGNSNIYHSLSLSLSLSLCAVQCVNNVKQSCRDRGGALCRRWVTWQELQKWSWTSGKLQGKHVACHTQQSHHPHYTLRLYAPGFFSQALYSPFGRNSLVIFLTKSPLLPTSQPPTQQKKGVVAKEWNKLGKVR
jgi:hypothetical protein